MHIRAIDDAAWESPWRRRRVGAKVLCSVGLVLTALLAPVWPGTLLVALASIALIVWSARIPPRVLGLSMAAPIIFLIFGAASIVINIGSAVKGAWWQWGWISVSRESALKAAEVFSHGVAGALAVMVLATTTPMVDLLTWLRRLHVPDPLLEIANLMYRMLFVLLATWLAVAEAMQSRLGDAAPWRRRLTTTADAIGSVALRAWNRADRLTEGMTNRGYESALTTLPPRTEPSGRFYAAVALLLIGIWLACVGVTL